MQRTTAHTIDASMRECIDNCLSCYAICEETKAHCIRTGGRHVEAEHLGTLADCIRLCEMSANFMLRTSELHGEVCRVCAEACERCARSCEQVDKNDEVMRRCAEECRRCAASCRQMAA
jgi:hypothetical protein